MYKPAIVVLIVITGIVVSGNSFSQESGNTLGWDLTYQSVFDAARVPENDTVAKYFNDSSREIIKNMFPTEFVEVLNNNEIDSAIFLDHQAFYYFGHRDSSLIIKSNQKVEAYRYFSEGGHQDKQDFPIEDFDKKLAGLWQWQQSEPSLQSEFVPDEGYVFSGFAGVLSLYRDGESKQILLTIDDFVDSSKVDSDGGDDSVPPGRLRRYMDYLNTSGASYKEFSAMDEGRAQDIQ